MCKRTHPYSFVWLHRSHIVHYRCDYCKLELAVRVHCSNSNRSYCAMQLQQSSFNIPLQLFQLAVATAVLRYMRPTHPDSSWPATWVSYYAVPLWLLQVGVPLRVRWRYSSATACTVASQPFVTVASEYPHSTLKGTLKGTTTYSRHSDTS